jgi:hypothetical protein
VRRSSTFVIAPLALLVTATSSCGSSSSGDAPGAGDAADALDAADEAESAVGEPAGIPASSCATGFESDGARGCRAILPSDACGPGTMAIPGDAVCRDVAPCADGTWGDVPVEASTQFVDASFGGTSDGSASAPWKTIRQAVVAATPGAIVAVAAGSYVESITLAKPVRLWGRCPSKVEIAGATATSAVVSIVKGADGTIVRGLAIRGGRVGVFQAGSRDVVLDRLWIHDGAGRGVSTQGDASTVVATLSDSLVERRAEAAVFVGATSVTIERTEIRDTQPDATGKYGQGIEVEDIGGTARASVIVRASVVATSHSEGVRDFGSDLTIEGSVVRDTAPRALDGKFGFGIDVEDDLGLRGTLTLRGSIVESNVETGVIVDGSNATIEATVVRDTQSTADGSYGEGVAVQLDRDTKERSTITVRSSLFDANRTVGLVVVASDATIDALLVRGTTARASDGLFGDGVCIFADTGSASAVVTASRVEGSARAGVSSFGADVTIGSTSFECNAIDLDGESLASVPFTFHDEGGNACGCSGASIACQISSSGLAPPEPIPAG